MSARVSPAFESVELNSSSSVSADARLMLSDSPETAGGKSASEQEASPAAAAMEHRPTGKLKKKKGIRALFLRTQRAVKHTALSCGGGNKVTPDVLVVEPMTQRDQVDPQPGPSSLGCELMTDPLLSRLDAGVTHVPGLSSVELRPDSDPDNSEPKPVPGPSDLEPDVEKPTKMRRKKKKGIKAFFRRTWKAMKLSISNMLTSDLCCNPVDIQPALSGIEWMLSIDPCLSGVELTVNADPTDPEPACNSGLSSLEMIPDSDPADPEPSPVPCPSNPSVALKLISVSEPSSVEVTPVPSLASMELTPDMGQADLEPSPVPGPSGFGPAAGEEEEKDISAFFLRKWRAVKHSILTFFRGNRVAPDTCGIESMAHRDPADPQPGQPGCALASDPGSSGLKLICNTSQADPESPSDSSQSNQELSAVPGPSSLKLTVDSKIAPAPSPGFGPAVGSFSSLYEVGVELGLGAHGIVYEGTRRSDGQKVAVKFIRRTRWEYFIDLPGSTKPLLAEVAVNLVMGKPPTSPHIIQMLEWFNQSDKCILVMEYPHPCETLLRFTARNGGYLDESVARGLMRQAVLAVKHCVERGVYHGDIKTDNMLVNTETLQLKFIDFGCSEFVITSGSQGKANKKWVVSVTVWSLGKLLFDIVSRDQSLHDFLSVSDDPSIPSSSYTVSRECRDLVQQCMHSDQTMRPTLEQILKHPWFKQGKLWRLWRKVL